MTPGEEEAKRRFREDTVPAFIDLLGMAEEALGGWRKRQGKDEPEWQEFDIKDLMLAANMMLTMASIGGARVQAAAGPPKAPPNFVSEELVQLDAAKVQGDFEAQLRMRGIDFELAKRVLAELVSTDKGVEMLQVMLLDAVLMKRRRKLPRTGGSQPGRLDELEGPHGEG
jgi:hypothetical protein